MQAQPIEFEDYKHDMDELGDRSAAIIKKLRGDVNDRERLIGILIKAAGGEIPVGDFLLEDITPLDMQVWRDEANRKTIYRVK